MMPVSLPVNLRQLKRGPVSQLELMVVMQTFCM